MTTLPQNTPMRIPRGANAITIPGTGGPGGGGMMPPMMPQPAAALTPGDLWRIFRANLWIIITLLILSAAAGYVVNKYWLDRYYRKYTATGFLRVQPGQQNNPITGVTQEVNLTAIEFEQRTQVQLLKHDSLLSDVFRSTDSRIKSTTWFAEFKGDVQAAKKELADELRVSVVPESKLIAISMSYSIPKDCTDIVMDVVTQHLKNQNREMQDDQMKRSTLLTKMLGGYERELTDLAASIRDKQIQLNIDEMGDPGRLNVREMRMQALVASQLELSIKGQALKAQLATMVKQNQQGEIPAAIKIEVDRDPVIQRIEMDLSSATIGETAPGAAANPSSLRQRAAVDNLRKLLETKRAQALGDAMIAAIETLQSSIAENEQNLALINAEVEKMKQEMGVLNNALAIFLTDKDTQKLLLEKKKEVEDSLDMLRVVQTQQDNASVTWAQYPQTPELPSFPKLSMTMAAAVVIGLALSVGIAFLREVADTSVRSPRDIHRIGSMNFLGMIPHEDDDPQARGSRLPLVIFDAPTSMMADQLRQVRTRLQYAASLDTTRSILVTSPGPNDGKTVIACNLAAGLALNGRRILIVDADFRRPALHKIFDVDNAKGFSDALQDVENFESFVRETQVPNLSVLTCGSKAGNATEMLESQLLVDFIERALEDYDHVIFDSGSIMVVSEAIALAPRVDGVVTVVRARSNSRGLLQRMRDTLRQLKAEHLGIILNAVRAQGGGYYGQNIKTYYAYQENV